MGRGDLGVQPGDGAADERRPLMLIGVPVLGLTLRGLGWFAQFERARFALFLGTRIPRRPAGP